MGDFSQGGWPAFIAVTTVPTNNPYGAFMYGEAGIQSAALAAKTEQQRQLSTGQGFLSITKSTNCTLTDNPPSASASKSVTAVDLGGGQAGYKVCDLTIITPGTAVSQALDQTLGINTQSLETAKYFDEIISALVSQLIQNVENNGLGGLSGTSGYASNDFGPVNTLQQDIGANIPQYEQAAEQLIGIENQNISDIQSSLMQLGSAAACWKKIATSASNTTATTTTVYSPAQITNAQQQGASVQANIVSLTNTKLLPYQQVLANATSSIVSLEATQAALDNTSNSDNTEALINAFIASSTTNAFVGAADLNNAQEDQIILLSSLATTNANAAASLSQCNAVTPQTTTP